jgi:hypothetical protein
LSSKKAVTGAGIAATLHGMRIEAYDFGSITIDGKTYDRDLKIVGGKIVPEWWRREGHKLLPEDIEDVLEAKPGVLVVGTGYDGLMRVSDAVARRLAGAGIDLVARPTREAIEEFNRLAETGTIAFAAHLTC